MKLTGRLKAEFARALRNFHYECSPAGLVFPRQRIVFGGVFATSVDGAPWQYDHNTVVLQGLDALLTAFFNNGTNPTGFYIAPFTNNTAPAGTLTGATFAAAQGEYTGYTQTARQQWVPNGASSGQSVSSSNAPATFTVGAAAVNITGAGLLATDSVKAGTTGTMIAAALFGAANSLNPGSTLKVQYTLSATSAT